jgi:uncharacterized protein involved in exopolysaccharide biosynthesis/Mrp family chromosome partitioning ATPase
MMEAVAPSDNRLSRDFVETSLRDLYTVIFRHETRIIFFFFAVMITVTLGTFLASEVFQSDAKLLVRLGRESVSLDPTATTGQVVSIGQDRENEVNSELAILLSRELAEKVVDAVGFDTLIEGPAELSGAADTPPANIRRWVKALFKPPAVALAKHLPASDPPDPVEEMRVRDKAVRLFSKNLVIEATKKSSIITISYDAQTPELARDVISKLIGFYLDKHITVHRTTGSYRFFDQQKDELQAALLKSESELRDLKNKTGVAVLPEQRRNLLDRTSGIERELEKTESDMAAATASLKSLQRNLGAMPQTQVTAETSGLPNSAADELRKHLNELQLKEQELLSTFTEESVTVKEIRRRIGKARSQLAKEELPRQITTGINANYQEVRMLQMKEEGSFAALQAKAGTLREQLSRAREELKNLNDTEIRLTQLQREREIQEANYRKYSGSLEQARMDHELEMEKISNISVVQPASFSVKPIRPKKLLNLALGFFMAVFGSLGLAFFTEYLDRSFKKPEDILRKLELPVIATIPLLPSGSPLLSEFPMSALQPMSNSFSKTSKKGPHNLLKFTGNCESLQECLRQLQGGSMPAPVTLAVTSAHAGEGVSTVVTHIAGMLAGQSDERVLIVDANLAHPGQHLKFGGILSPGLADIISNGQVHAGAIQHSRIENIDLLAAGEGAVNLGRNADRKSLAELLPAFKREYSHVIFDIPSLQNNAAGAQLAGIMDGVILVVEAESTRWEVAQQAKERLLEARATMLGVILNKRRLYVPEWLYKTL